MLCALVLSACSGSSGTTIAPLPASTSHAPSAASTVTVLPIGKQDLPLAPGSYVSPDGFVPSLGLTVPPGWTSTHRGDDAFDFARKDPATPLGKAAPPVAVLLVTPLGNRVAEALQKIHRSATGVVTPVTGTLAGQPATGFDIVGGTGQLLASPSATLALDAAPGQHLRVLGTDVDGVPLLAVVVVPDGSRWKQLLPVAQALLSGVLPT